MDQFGNERAVVFGLPLVKKWDAYDPLKPSYYLDDDSLCCYYSATDHLVLAALQSVSGPERNRFAPLICGFNPTDKHGVQHVERMLECSDVWRGVGEVLLRHDDLTNLTNEETARANHPAMKPVYKLCEQRGLPVLLHQNSTSVGRPDDYVYLHGLREVLECHPDLCVVWAHCGLSRRVFHEHYHEMIEMMLTAYTQLHVDVSWIGFDDVVVSEGLVRTEWGDLIERFADRFMIGSDLTGHFDHLGPTMRRYNGLLEELSPDARQKVADGNADRVFFGGRPD